MQDPGELKKLIQRWSEEIGFDGIGVAGIDINEDEKYLNKWLENIIISKEFNSVMKKYNIWNNTDSPLIVDFNKIEN